MTSKKNNHQHSNEDKSDIESNDFINNNANGNGINPNPIESGNSANWEQGQKENEQYQKDAHNTSSSSSD